MYEELFIRLNYDVVLTIFSYLDKDGIKAWIEESELEDEYNKKIYKNFKDLSMERLITEIREPNPIYSQLYSQYVLNFRRGSAHTPTLYTRLFKMDEWCDFFENEMNICMCRLKNFKNARIEDLECQSNLLARLDSDNLFYMKNMLRTKIMEGIEYLIQEEQSILRGIAICIELDMDEVQPRHVLKAMFWRYYNNMLRVKDWHLRKCASRIHILQLPGLSVDRRKQPKKYGGIFDLEHIPDYIGFIKGA
jgi:hypothetical protein